MGGDLTCLKNLPSNFLPTGKSFQSNATKFPHPGLHIAIKYPKAEPKKGTMKISPNRTLQSLFVNVAASPKAREGYQYIYIYFFKNLYNNKSIEKWHFMCLSLAYPRDRTLGNPGKYLWELNILGSLPLGGVIFRPKLFKSWIVLSTG